MNKMETPPNEAIKMWAIKYDGQVSTLENGQILDKYSHGNYTNAVESFTYLKDGKRVTEQYNVLEMPRIVVYKNRFFDAIYGVEVKTNKSVVFINKKSNLKPISDTKIISPYVYSIWTKDGVRVDLNNVQSNILHTWSIEGIQYREVLFGKLIVRPGYTPDYVPFAKNEPFRWDVRNMDGDRMLITRRIVPFTTKDTTTNWKIQKKGHLSAEVCEKLEEWLETGTKALKFFGYDFAFNAKIMHGVEPYLYVLVSPQNAEQYHTVIVRRDVPILTLKYVPSDGQGDPSFFNPKTRQPFFDFSESKVVWKWMQSGKKHDVLFKSTLILRYDRDKSILNVSDARTGETTELIPQLAMVESEDDEDFPPILPVPQYESPLALEEEKESSPFQPRKQGFPPRKYQYEPKSSTVDYASSLERCRADVSIPVDGSVILVWVKAGNRDLVLPGMTVIYPARVDDNNLSYYAELTNGKLFISNEAPTLTVLPIKNLLGYVYEWNDGRNEWTSFPEDVSFAIHDWKTKALYMHEIVYRYDETTVFILTHSRDEGRVVSNVPKTRRQEAHRSVKRITIRYKARTYRIKTVF